MSIFLAPELRNDFGFIVNAKRQDLIAVALSYLYEAGRYLPIFSFRDVEVSQDTQVDAPDVYMIQRRRAHEFGVFSNNALVEMGGCGTLILLGLTDEQKSYLNYLHHYNVFDIVDMTNIENYLSGFATQKHAPIECDLEQIGEGLITALKSNSLLRIGSHNLQLGVEDNGIGVVVIESYPNTDNIVAINYACSIGANVLFVEGLDEDEDESILHLIEDWESEIEGAFTELCTKITDRIDPVGLNPAAFVTFFTKGLPYSIMHMECPISYVHFQYRPDFFLFNAFIYEKFGCIGSAVVFSPGYFKDEETNSLISLLEFENFYLRALLDREASVYNLTVTIDSFPFDLLHVCSHGGDVDECICPVFTTMPFYFG